MLTEKREQSTYKEDIHFCGHVKEEELSAYYRTAHLYCSMSEHEGYGVPLAEAMWHQIPILAFDAGAVAETLGEGGIIFQSKENMRTLASLAAILLTDTTLRQKVIDAQLERAITLHKETVKKSYLSPLLEALHFPIKAETTK